jgi:SPP1 gp7 family putative phage head morphogenesis protein
MPAPGSVYEQIEQTQVSVHQMDKATRAKLNAEYARLRTDIEAMGMLVAGNLIAQVAAGVPPSPADLLDLVELVSAWKQLNQQVNRYGSSTAKTVSSMAASTGSKAIADAEKLLAASGLDGQPNFQKLNAGAVNAIVGATADASPLRGVLLDMLGPQLNAGPLSDQLANRLVDGVARGYNPRKVARLMVKDADVAHARALLVARTEMLRAYREASRSTYLANGVTEYTWHSALDARTCACCWSLHGRRFTTSEPMPAHPNCRCTLIPFVPGWSPEVEDGEAKFAGLDEEQQKAILGPAKYSAYSAGQAKLTDFVGERIHPKWGRTYHERSLVQALGGTAASKHYSPNYKLPTAKSTMDATPSANLTDLAPTTPVAQPTPDNPVPLKPGVPVVDPPAADHKNYDVAKADYDSLLADGKIQPPPAGYMGNVAPYPHVTEKGQYKSPHSTWYTTKAAWLDYLNSQPDLVPTTPTVTPGVPVVAPPAPDHKNPAVAKVHYDALVAAGKVQPPPPGYAGTVHPFPHMTAKGQYSSPHSKWYTTQAGWLNQLTPPDGPSLKTATAAPTPTVAPAPSAAVNTAPAATSPATPSTQAPNTAATPAPAPTPPPPAPKPLSGAYTGHTVDGQPMPAWDDLVKMQKIGGPLGSNGGQWYVDPATGRTFLAKPAKSLTHASNEVGIAALYQTADAPIPRVSVTTDPNGKHWVLSEKVDITDIGTGGMTPALRATAREHMGIDMLTSNWDAFGLTGDNVGLTADGRVLRIDVGGGGLFRAMGDPKPSFNPNDPWIEPGTMLASAQGKALYGTPTNAEFAAAMRRAADIDMAGFDAAMVDAGVDASTRKKLFDTVAARKTLAADLANTYGTYTPDAPVKLAGSGMSATVAPGGAKVSPTAAAPSMAPLTTAAPTVTAPTPSPAPAATVAAPPAPTTVTMTGPTIAPAPSMAPPTGPTVAPVVNTGTGATTPAAATPLPKKVTKANIADGTITHVEGPTGLVFEVQSISGNTVFAKHPGTGQTVGISVGKLKPATPTINATPSPSTPGPVPPLNVPPTKPLPAKVTPKYVTDGLVTHAYAPPGLTVEVVGMSGTSVVVKYPDDTFEVLPSSSLKPVQPPSGWAPADKLPLVPAKATKTGFYAGEYTHVSTPLGTGKVYSAVGAKVTVILPNGNYQAFKLSQVFPVPDLNAVPFKPAKGLLVTHKGHPGNTYTVVDINPATGKAQIETKTGKVFEADISELGDIQPGSYVYYNGTKHQVYATANGKVTLATGTVVNKDSVSKASPSPGQPIAPPPKPGTPSAPTTTTTTSAAPKPKSPPPPGLTPEQVNQWNAIHAYGGPPISHVDATETDVRLFTTPDTGQRWGTAASRDWRQNKLTAQESNAIRTYTGSSFDNWNRTLRQGGVPPGTAKQAAAGLRKSVLENDMVLTRGIFYRRSEWTHSVGDVVYEPAFMSTSAMANPAFDKEVILRLRVPAGTEGAYVGNISNYKREIEVVLPPGVTYRVLAQTEVNGRLYIDGELVGQGFPPPQGSKPPASYVVPSSDPTK